MRHVTCDFINFYRISKTLEIRFYNNDQIRQRSVAGCKSLNRVNKKATNQPLSDFQVQNLNILQVLLGKYQHPKNKSDFLMGLQNCFKLFRRVPS